MNFYKENEKSKAICENCRKIVITTFKYGDFKLNNLIIPDILLGYCDICGEVVSVPHQSTYKINSYRKQHETKKKEFRIPLHMHDVLYTIGAHSKISRKPNTICRIVSKYYLTKLKSARHKTLLSSIYKSTNDVLAKGASKSRLSCVFDLDDYKIFMERKKELGVSEATLLKGFIMTAKYDFLDKDDKKLKAELEEIAHQVL